MRERSPGTWQLRAFEGVAPITGQKRYGTRSFHGTKRQAQKALNGLVAEVDGGVVAPSAKTVAGLLEEWLAHIEHLGRSPSTLFGYRRLVPSSPTTSSRCRSRRSRQRSSTTSTGSSASPRPASRRLCCDSTPCSEPSSPRPCAGAGSTATPSSGRRRLTSTGRRSSRRPSRTC